MHSRIAPLAVAAAAVLALGLAGCSAGNGSGSTSGKPLVIAMPLPLTSGNASTAADIVDAAKCAVDDINKNGGAGGRQITLKTYDDQLTADGAAQVTQRAITVDGAEIVVGAYTTIEGLAIRQITDPKKIVFVSPSTISPQLTADAGNGTSKYILRTTHTQDAYPALMAQAAKDLKLTNVVVVHDDSPSGSTMGDPIGTALTGDSIETSDVGYKLNATDLSSQVAQIKAANPDGLIVISSSGADQGLLLKTMVEQGVTVPTIGLSSIVSADAVKIGGDAFTQVPVYSIQNKQPDKPLYTDFITKCKSYFGGDSDVATLAGTLPEPVGATWDSFQLIKKWLDEDKGSTNGDTIMKEAAAMAPYTSVAGKEGATISFANGPVGFQNAMATLKWDPSKGILQTAQF